MRWESSGEGDYTVETVHKETRGTDVVLHPRPEEDDLPSGLRLREILRKYSDHVTRPILMKKERRGTEEEHMNQASALWARPKAEVTEEQYHEFYKHVAHDFEAPLAYTHARSKAARNSLSCSSSRSGRRSTCGTASIGAASSSTSAGYSSWTMPSSCCRRICGSCAGSSTRATCR